ncbi:MAG: DUF2281 domain-containing protein [Planctomycetia bacterium]|nr:DUF2281 domain-containing protein [Candidatus Brocadia sp.]QOJ06241.1 MAG: DUF2281 domain-containing protein [Planctomycetia bacterium]TVL94803.1 MAG: hypothetical protein CV082_13510 [Candidatus Brocadia sp. BL1]HQU32185.1 DUF2281 domain-containing protein [Candidatus Brocadia sapporoensis]
MISKLPPEYQQEIEDFVEFIFKKYGLTPVSFDTDFERTERGRKRKKHGGRSLQVVRECKIAKVQMLIYKDL